MEENREVVDKFMSVTGADEERAKFFLEANANNIEEAIVNFFENSEFNNEPSDVSVLPASGNPQPEKTKKDEKNTRFGTIASLSSSSDEEETGQAFYAGGSTHSGQQVLGPPRSKHQIIADMFRSVREQGGEPVPDQPGSSHRNAITFSGTGYRLGQTEQDSQVIASSDETRRREVTVTLKMWSSGFTVDDGPLRLYNDPENLKFLGSVSRGIIPEELIRDARGSEVNLNMEDHSEEDFVPSKAKLKAFSGKGNVLGNPVPGTSVAPPASSSNPAGDLEKAKTAIAVDPSQPTTNVQIRLADGSRIVANLNHTHTVADLRNFITIARPEYANQPFRLLTTFPSKELTDGTATVVEAELLNAAVMQRLG